jgi:hypothetical protein
MTCQGFFSPEEVRPWMQLVASCLPSFLSLSPMKAMRALGSVTSRSIVMIGTELEACLAAPVTEPSIALRMIA